MVQASSNCSYQAIQEYLQLDKDNNKLTSLRPVLHWETPTFVAVDLYVSAITEVGWLNEFTAWNPADFCGITVMTVRKEMLWIPDVTILENIRTEFSTQESPYVKLMSNSFAVLGQTYTMTTACKMDLYLFPFDIQSCTLTLQSLMHNIEEFTINAYSNASMLTLTSKQFFQNQGEWDLVSINMSKTRAQSSGRQWDQLTYTITIKRRPLLYVVIFLLPILYFLVLDLASFFIADDGGEKLSFKVTLLLAISVLLLILHDMLPSTSDKLPLIGVYCSIIFTFTAISLLETMLVIFLQNCSIQVIRKQCEESSTTLQDTEERAPQNTPDISAGTNGESCSTAVLQQIITELQKACQQKKTHQQKMSRWTKVAKVIDKTFFVIYLFGVMLFLLKICEAWLNS
ncbi:hypothetical protein NFI96_030237 [Prochilodus magdalenae]|nr:hypothetical protein NFI96_030237 [Prochilodus magdalenae]